MQETQALATFVADTRYADLPSSLIAECKIATLDVFAAAFVGSSLPWAQHVVEMVHELGGTPEVSVVNQPWKTDVSRAALANGAMIGAFECEPLTGSHAAGTVLPAALAVSQRNHRDGKAFLLAIAVGFELSGRLQKTAVGLESTRDMSNPLVYNDAAVKDPLVRSLAKNMELIVDKTMHEAPGGVPAAEVEIVCGGKTYKKVTSPHKGSPHNPLTWADACEKFSRYTRTLIGVPQAKAIMDAVADLENQSNMARIATLMAKA